MNIRLRTFEEIINPGRLLIAAPHRFTPVFDRFCTIKAREEIEEQIKALAPETSIPATEEEKERRAVNEPLRQIKLRKLQSKKACYPVLNLARSTSYVEDSLTPSDSTVRHGKA